MDNSSGPAPKVSHRHSWSTPIAASAALAGGGLILLICGWLFGVDPVGRLLLTVAGIAALAAGIIGSVQRPRLAITDEPVPHLLIRGLTGTREYPPERVEVARMLFLQHIGRQTPQLSLELLAPEAPPAGSIDELREDTRLMTFGRWSLGEDPAAVLDHLEAAGFRVDRRDRSR